MKKHIVYILTSVTLLLAACEKDKAPSGPAGVTPIAVTKTNTTKVYMHYMPWFHSKAVSGYWGSHWRMANKNPENILPNGQREIAAHYYPLIGPYDSADPDVIDYHTLLMKYAGVDGVLIDWYGSHNILDYGSNLKNANALISGVEKTGLEYALVYEDYTAEEVERRKPITALEAARLDMMYAQTHYFDEKNYIRIAGKPLMLTFGPRYFLQEAQWTQILDVLSSPIAFYPLWNHEHRTGPSNTTGQFSWVDFTTDLTILEKFYDDHSPAATIGSVYPGFHDYYAQGGWGDSYGFVDHAGGATLARTLSLADAYHLPFVQLVTWNDFGEGTMIEPTVEFEYEALEKIQTFTGVPYDSSDLARIHTYYLKRKELAADTTAQNILDDIYDALIQLDVNTAEELINQL